MSEHSLYNNDEKLDWIIHHRAIDDNGSAAFTDYVETINGGWTVWRTQMTLTKALKKLAMLSMNEFYSYRAVNIRTGEIIPGEIFQ